MPPRSNIVLIGMPGAGKSTVGVLLAKLTARDFTDTDLVIQTREGRTLQEILDADGYLELRKVEERILLTLDLHNHVIATGGSAAYSAAAMEHLRQNGVIVFVHVGLDTIRRRVRDFDTRGIARAVDQSLENLFEERYRLYTKYADVTVEGEGLTADELATRIRSTIDR